MLSGDIIPGVGDISRAGVRETVRGQERTAAHTGVYIAFELTHDFGGNIIRNHTPGGTFGGKSGQIPVRRTGRDVAFFQYINQFRKRGRYPYAGFILDAFITL